MISHSYFARNECGSSETIIYQLMRKLEETNKTEAAPERWGDRIAGSNPQLARTVMVRISTYKF
jgi:hypothetical protein